MTANNNFSVHSCVQIIICVLNFDMKQYLLTVFIKDEHNYDIE